MRALATLLLLVTLVACRAAPLPTDGTPYAARITPGDNLYPRQETRLYATDVLVEITEAHPANGMQASREARTLPQGTWARLLRLNASAKPARRLSTPPCCHLTPSTYLFHAHPGPLHPTAFEAALAP